MFSRDQLLKAFQQMEEENQKDYDLARKAAEWLEQKTKLSVVVRTWPKYSPGYRHEAPWLSIRVLEISYSQYHNLNEWVVEQKNLNPITIPGIGADCFLLKLGPAEGFAEEVHYNCILSQYDAHESGF